MIKYKINKAEWADKNHLSIICDVTSIEDGKEIETFTYAVNESDESPLNKILFQQLKTDNVEIQENKLLQIIAGKLPVPEGHTLIDGQLFDDYDRRAQVRSAVEQLLNELYSGRSQAMAERDSVYAENRKNRIDMLLEIENTPGFPYSIDLRQF